MMQINPLLLVDGYKVDHRSQYPSDTQDIYSNLTARKSMDEGVRGKGVIFFGLSYFIQEFLIRQFYENFFLLPKESVLKEYKQVIEGYLGKDCIKFDHIEALHDLGYLPLKIKALPEGSYVPCGVPMLTVVNTHPDFFWLTNMIETLMSSVLWKMTTNATTAFLFKKQFVKYAKLTSDSELLVPWQGHDFSFRGMSGPEDAMSAGAAHLTSFTGTDSIPAVLFMKEYYSPSNKDTVIGGSVPATEHSVMCVGGQENEIDTYRRLLTEVYPTGIVSIVSDTWDYWNVLTNILPQLKDEIMARDGKVVIRPDSGNPVDIICGESNSDGNLSVRVSPFSSRKTHSYLCESHTPQEIGTISLLYNTFGGTENSKGYIELDPHIVCIYGDSITLEKQEQILSKLKQKCFASTNIVLGLGSYSYQYVTRDTYGFAMKATHAITESRGAIDIYKDPATDRAVGGSKKSHKGLLKVYKVYDRGEYKVKDQCTVEEEDGGWLEEVFYNGNERWLPKIDGIRSRIESNIEEALDNE